MYPRVFHTLGVPRNLVLHVSPKTASRVVNVIAVCSGHSNTHCHIRAAVTGNDTLGVTIHSTYSKYRLPFRSRILTLSVIAEASFFSSRSGAEGGSSERLKVP